MVCSAANCTDRLIQQNDGSGFFNRPWAEFKVGFGDPSSNYWLGNDLLSQLTANNRYKLRFDLQQRNTGNWYYAEYSTFIVLSEADNYELVVGGFSGNASYDALGREHNNGKFITFDRGNDQSSNCAPRCGGFWYRSCSGCQVNGASSTYTFLWSGLARSGGSNLQYSRMSMQCK